MVSRAYENILCKDYSGMIYRLSKGYTELIFPFSQLTISEIMT